jgi:hypothetical protein
MRQQLAVVDFRPVACVPDAKHYLILGDQV